MIYFEAGVTGTYSRNHPRVGWNSAARRGTLSASSEETGFEAVNAGSPFEYTYWKPTGTTSEWLALNLSTAENINAVCIASHNLGDVGATLQVQITAGTWDNVGPDITPENNDPIAFLLKDRDLTDIRLQVTGASAAATIGVVYFCTVLEFPQKVYVQQGAPYNLSQVTEYRNNRTINGKYSGRSIKRQRPRVSAPLQHIREPWIDANMADFIEDAQEYPYFLMPRPEGNPKDIGYKWAEEDIRPSRMGISGDMMEVTI